MIVSSDASSYQAREWLSQWHKAPGILAENGRCSFLGTDAHGAEVVIKIMSTHNVEAAILRETRCLSRAQCIRRKLLA
jgi:hypothetical protein